MQLNATSQELLVSLSRLDTMLRELDQQIEAAPERLERLREVGRRLEAELEAAEQELETTRAARRAHESEAESLSEKIGVYEQQLYAIKSNNEYQAMLRQIAEARSRTAECENQALECMEREEELAARLAAERTRIQAEIGTNRERQDELETQLEAMTRRRAQARDERQTLVATLDGGLRRRYERIHRGMGGLAVVAVAKGACGGCFSTLPPQRINEARVGGSLIVCEACGRMVVWDEARSGA